MLIDSSVVVSEIDGICAEYRALKKRSKVADLSDKPMENRVHLLSLMVSAIKRFAPPGSSYAQQLESLLMSGESMTLKPSLYLGAVYGTLYALRDDYKSGRTVAMHELIRADLFSSMLEQAQHLLDERYKDPAAVVAGSVLEEHIRKLCSKHGVPVSPGGAPRKTSMLNQDLRQAGAYDKTEEKHVTAWLGIRNSAAHGLYGEYDDAQVKSLVGSVRDFIVRHPA